MAVAKPMKWIGRVKQLVGVDSRREAICMPLDQRGTLDSLAVGQLSFKTRSRRRRAERAGEPSQDDHRPDGRLANQPPANSREDQRIPVAVE